MSLSTSPGEALSSLDLARKLGFLSGEHKYAHIYSLAYGAIPLPECI